MGGDGFDATPGDLTGASSGVADAIAGIGETLGEISGSSEAFGHAGLHSACSQFWSTMNSTVTALRDNASNLGTSLTDAAGRYTENDTGVADYLQPCVDQVLNPGGA